MLTLLTCMTIATIPTQRIHRPIAALVLRQQAPSAWALPCSPHVRPAPALVLHVPCTCCCTRAGAPCCCATPAANTVRPGGPCAASHGV
jgi:hypothetical protein